MCRQMEEDSTSVYRLRDILSKWGVPNGEKVAARWKCRLVARPETTADAASAILDGIPIIGPDILATEVHRACRKAAGGEDLDGIDFVTKPEWNVFPAPKIAFRSGWGAPGTKIGSDDHLVMVSSFQEVIEDSSGPQHVQMPVLSSLLQWPEAKRLHLDEHSWVVDLATRVSCGGAITWWHLDDCGEFTIQAALPLNSQRISSLRSTNGLPVVKIFLFFPRDWYDMVFQDAETNRTGEASCIDLFDCSDEQLPIALDGDFELPTLYIAALEAGGPPLISPPNWPHLVITIDTCVMVEQRRVMKLFIDEVKYFFVRAQNWAAPPIVYKVIQESFHQMNFDKAILAPLLSIARDVDLDLSVRSRAVLSLLAVLDRRSDFLFRKKEDSTECVEEMKTKCGCVLESLLKEDTTLHQMVHNPLRLKSDDYVMASATNKRGGITVFPNKVYAFYSVENGKPRWGIVRDSLQNALQDRALDIKRKLHTEPGALSEFELFD